MYRKVAGAGFVSLPRRHDAAYFVKDGAAGWPFLFGRVVMRRRIVIKSTK
jgi:hypothetical protein